jgi:hypothetical protein
MENVLSNNLGPRPALAPIRRLFAQNPPFGPINGIKGIAADSGLRAA